MDRMFINRYVLVIETDRPNVKHAGKIHRSYEAMSTKRQAEQELNRFLELNKKVKNKRAYIVDQDKQPDYVFHENQWANP